MRTTSIKNSMHCTELDFFSFISDFCPLPPGVRFVKANNGFGLIFILFEFSKLKVYLRDKKKLEIHIERDTALIYFDPMYLPIKFCNDNIF